jgi:ankyrin repeat protein
MSQAAREGNLDALASLAKMDPGLVNQSNQFGQTPLRAAALANRTNSVEFLEQHGAHWDAISAVWTGRAEVLRRVLAEQPLAITNALGGSDLLHIAAAKGDLACVRVLLDKGADVHATDLNGLSPLGIAWQNRRPELAALLREHGATENPFDAIQARGADILSGLISKNKSVAMATNSSGSSLLEAAAGAGNTNAMLLLLKRRVSVNITNRLDGRTPLHAAAANNQYAAARLLLERGALVDTYDTWGFTPLHLAAVAGSTETAKVLLDHKAEADAPVIEGAPPLLTLNRAAPLMGDSALHLAALCGQTEVLQLLLHSGASINATNDAGLTPLDLATRPGFLPMPPLFASRVMRTGRPAPGQLLNGQKAAADLLEKAGGKHGNPRGSAGHPPGFSGPGAFLNQQ